jgi:hypothetical protein
MDTEATLSQVTRQTTPVSSMPPVTVTTEGIPAQEHIESTRSERWTVILVWALGVVLAALAVFALGYALGANGGTTSPRDNVPASHTYPAPMHHGV